MTLGINYKASLKTKKNHSSMDKLTLYVNVRQYNDQGLNFLHYRRPISTLHH